MGAPTWMRDAAIGLVAGQTGNVVMGRVTTKLLELESESARTREKKVSPGVSYTIAAQQLSAQAGLHLSDQEAGRLGTVFHLGLGLGAGEVYVALRCGTSLGPISSALLVSLALFLGIDEGITPLMGWSAPASAYPPETHLRGLLGHLSLGATVAATAEILFWLMDAE